MAEFAAGSDANGLWVDVGFGRHPVTREEWSDAHRAAGITLTVTTPDNGLSPLRVRNSMLRQTHEAIRTRFGILVPVCGTQLRNAVEAEEGCEVTCPMCNGTIRPVNEEASGA